MMNPLIRRLLLAGVLLVLALVTGWLLWPDPNVARARELQQQLFGAEARKLSPKHRQQKWREYREVTKQLSPAQQQQLSAEARKQKQRELARYFTLSPQEKTRFLDEQIRRQERMHQGRPVQGQQVGNRGPARGTARPGGSKGGTVQEKDQRRQRFLDGSSPAERAQLTQFFREMNARRAQLGLPGSGRGGPR
jgi:hypothetical protein